jgi:hypothetical protein
MHWRILHDRRPILAWTGDKLAMKDEAARRAPGIRIVEPVWVGTDVRELAGLDLPDRWILKPNHTSGRFLVGAGPVDHGEAERLRALTAPWMDRREYVRLREWAYSLAKPVFLVEPFLGPGPDAPADYKIMVFDGVPRIVHYVTDRLRGSIRSFFTPAWEFVDLRSVGPSDPTAPKPPHVDRVLAAAAELGREFDHIRVDLYEVDGEVWFGEYTAYSWSGLQAFEPASIDQEWGSWWRLPGRTED